MPLIRTPSNPDSFLELKSLVINRELSGVGNPEGFALFLFALLLTPTGTPLFLFLFLTVIGAGRAE